MADAEGRGPIKITLKRILAASIALGLASATANAQEVNGAPDALIGKYGNSPEQCRSYHRKSDNISIITKETFTFCGGSGCEAKIVSHRKTKDGYVLKLISRGNPDGWTQTFRQLDENVFEVPYKGRAPETLVRCTIKDAIAGIGREPNDSGAVTQSMAVVYAALYAQAVPSACPDLRVNQDKIKELILVGQVAWAEHLLKYKLVQEGKTLEEKVRQSTKLAETAAKYAVQADAKEIPEYCSEVLNKFGLGGNFIPDLIVDRKA